jgi:hypothetical protein
VRDGGALLRRFALHQANDIAFAELRTHALYSHIAGVSLSPILICE